MSANHSSFEITEDKMNVFHPIVSELNRRVDGEGSGSLMAHHIGVQRDKTKTLFFEVTHLLNEEMQEALSNLVLEAPQSDGIPRRCKRALANHYKTELTTSSKDYKPQMLPHRDDVGSADVSVVLGITPKSEFRGAFLCVSTEPKEGKIWYENKERGVPSRKTVVCVEMSKGVCVILKNKVEHYVSTLQRGRRGSLVFHMTSLS